MRDEFESFETQLAIHRKEKELDYVPAKLEAYKDLRRIDVHDYIYIVHWPALFNIKRKPCQNGWTNKSHLCV